ncbi:hypothetical protein PsorP6_015904 [Peronosclerospora sorghi]|uniref:Uncharacterized protein n=1 Tax=Peronosclerospora sorghi TaxID=230839 RepID=A0ACC0WNL7_9STRA|nr:hypothetical protein PsorP6_015904 [Peronosclerospora sorghi]
MRWWFVLLASIVSSTWLRALVNAAACPEICYTTELTGFGPGGVGGCSCTGSGPTRAGAGGCSCGQCYVEANGAITGYAIDKDGTCPFGTNCGDCTRSSTASNSSKSTTDSSDATNTTTAPVTTPAPTPSPNATIATPAPSTTKEPDTPTTPTPSSSHSDANDTKEVPSSASHIANDEGLKTWQIALIICCGVLVFTVAVVSVLSCYCKARNRLNENEDEQADASYYQQPLPRQPPTAFNATATPTLYPAGPMSNPSHHRSVSFESSGRLSTDTKPMYANPANSNSSERLRIGLVPVQMRTSSGDAVPLGASYSHGSKERMLSNSCSSDRLASSCTKHVARKTSWEQSFQSARDRELLAVDL